LSQEEITMLCALVGTACLIALFKVLRHRACGGYGRLAYAGGCGWHGPHAWGGHAPGAWRERFSDGGGPEIWLRAAFERLQTTPSQEKVIRAAVVDLRDAAKKARSELRGARSELAQALRSEVFDENAVWGAVAHFEGMTEALRRAGIDAFAKIHGALDERQRAALADIVESAPRMRGWGGPYRSWM
jgi:Spy/CpxP family protein refolding chaperone